MKLTLKELKNLIKEELPMSQGRGPAIRITVSFDLVPGPEGKIDLGGFRAKLRAIVAGLTARAITSTHEIEVKPTNVNFDIKRV